MIKRILFVLIVAVSLVSCKSKSAFNYSQDIVKKEKSLMNDINSTEANVEKFIAAEQYDSIAAAGARMEKLVDAKLTEIKDQPAPDVKEGEAFKDASVKYFSFIKSMYSGYRTFGSVSTPEEREKQMDKLRELVSKKTQVISDMQAAQKKFANANGFKLENN